MVQVCQEARAERKQRLPGDRRGRMHPAPALQMAQRPDRQLLEADHVGTIAGHELDHLAEVGPALGRDGIAVEEIPGADEHGHGVAYGAVRVLLADPPAFTPPYDHELAAALARAGADVELVTSRFRFGAAPEPDGYRAPRGLLPAVVARLRPLAAAPPAQGRGAPARARALAPAPARTSSTSSGCPRPSSTRASSARDLPPVFTAHDLLPRRTAHRTELWRRLFGRFDRIVVHSENGRATLAELGVPSREAARHPPPGLPERARAARTTAARCSRSG